MPALGLQLAIPGYDVNSKGLPAPSLAYTFANDGPLPAGTSFSRATGGSRINNVGTYEVLGNNLPRYDYDPLTLASLGLYLEPQRTNSLRNNTGAGAVVGTPGTSPNNWNINPSPSDGLSYAIAALGFDAGIDYVDLRVSGTAGPAIASATEYETTTGIAGVNGQTFAQSVYFKRVAGTFTGVTSITNAANILNGSAVSQQTFVGTDLLSSIDGTLRRFTNTYTITAGAATNVRPRFRFTYTNGAAIDFTIRIGLPQVELGATSTSALETTSAAVTRNADVLTTTLTATSDVLVQDTLGGQWYTNIAAGSYAIQPRTNQTRITRWRAYPAGTAAANPGLAVAFVPDTTPNAFVFTDVTNAPLSTLTTSAPVTITGINAPAAISVTGGNYSINGGTFVTTAGTVNNGDSVRAQNTSSASNSTAVNTVVTVGGVSDTFTTTTLAASGPTPVFDVTMMTATLDPLLSYTLANGGSRTNSLGNYEFVSAGTPRFDYDPVTLALKGLLIEDGRTNLNDYSHDYTNATWTGGGATLGATSTVRGWPMTRWAETAASSPHQISHTADSAGSATYCFSLVVKAAERSFVALFDSSSSVGKYYDLTLGTVLGNLVGAPTGASGIIDCGGGVYRCWFATSTSNPRMIAFIADSGTTFNYAGNTSNGLLLGPSQVEVSARPTSYMPTTSAAQLRSGDILTVNGTNFSSFYNNSQGTWAIEFDKNDNGNSPFLLGVAANNGPEMEFTSQDVRTTLQGVAYTNTGFTVTPNTPSKIVYGYANANYASSMNGAAIQTSSAAGTIAAQTAAFFGASSSGNRLNGHIRRVRYFNTRLTNAEIVTLST